MSVAMLTSCCTASAARMPGERSSLTKKPRPCRQGQRAVAGTRVASARVARDDYCLSSSDSWQHCYEPVPGIVSTQQGGGQPADMVTAQPTRLPANRSAGFENTAAVSCPMLSSPLLAWAMDPSQLLSSKSARKECVSGDKQQRRGEGRRGADAAAPAETAATRRTRAHARRICLDASILYAIIGRNRTICATLPPLVAVFPATFLAEPTFASRFQNLVSSAIACRNQFFHFIIHAKKHGRPASVPRGRGAVGRNRPGFALLPSRQAQRALCRPAPLACGV